MKQLKKRIYLLSALFLILACGCQNQEEAKQVSLTEYGVTVKQPTTANNKQEQA